MADSGAQVKLEPSISNPQILLAWDENALMKSIYGTHGPENHEINVKPFLKMIESILKLSASASKEFQPSGFQEETLSEKNLGDKREYLANRINSISCEILGNCSPGQDRQETLLAIFNALSTFSWDAKGVIALAAFVVNYGEFWLVTRISKQNAVASSLSLLEHLPEQDEEFKKLGSDMDRLTRALLDLIKCLCDFRDLKMEFKNIRRNAPELQKAEALFPAALYWTIRSIVICQSQIINLTGTGFVYISNSEAWEIPSLAEKVVQMYTHLKKQLEICYQLGETNRVTEVYQKIANNFEATHSDNQVVLEGLLGSNEGALFNCSSKKLESVRSLGGKMVLLYISGPKPSTSELMVLVKMYNSSLTRLELDYEIVWIPVVDKSSPWNEKRQKSFEDARDSMPWFSLARPSLLDPAVTKFINSVWKFEKRPILVTLSPKGNVTNTNAMYMVTIWGSHAHPFSSIKEEELWKLETWGLGFLVDSIEPLIQEWVASRKFVCIYGGEDMEWIKEFTARAKSVAASAGLPLEMLYLGTSKSQEKIERNNATIKAENLSHTMASPNRIMLFWFRLECIWQSRVQRGMSPETDHIIQETFVMQSFNCSERGWAIISRDDQMAKAMGDTMVHCLREFDQWRIQAVRMGFLEAMKEQISQICWPHTCNILNWSESYAGIPDKMVCFECNRPMHKVYAFMCCG